MLMPVLFTLRQELGEAGGGFRVLQAHRRGRLQVTELGTAIIALAGVAVGQHAFVRISEAMPSVSWISPPAPAPMFARWSKIEPDST
jgi:molybdopterin synthase catalytic subunit